VSTDLRVLHTSQVEPALLDAAHAMLVDVFEGDFGPDNWDHALGGMHVLLLEGDELVGHGAVVQRRVLHGGRALRCGYVEAIGVRADRRRRGYGGLIMSAVGELVRGAYDLGALGVSEDGAPLYRAHGWESWSGETFALTPDGTRRTPDADDSLMVLPVSVQLDPREPLTCDWRDGEIW
jgi:aminoglycoside 2'-N-acetyltransferase I